MKLSTVVGLAVVLFGSTLAEAGDVPKNPAEFLEHMSFFTGEWKGTSKSANETHTATWSIKETPNKQCHMVFATADGEPAGQSLWGFDPKVKRWKGTWFAADGRHGTTTILDPPKRRRIEPGDVWTSAAKGTTLEGEPTSNSGKWIIVDKDTVRIESTQRTKGSEKEPDEVTVMKRQ